MSTEKVRIEIAGAMYTCKLHPHCGSIFRNGKHFMTLPLQGRTKQQLIWAAIEVELNSSYFLEMNNLEE